MPEAQNGAPPFEDAARVVDVACEEFEPKDERGPASRRRVGYARTVTTARQVHYSYREYLAVLEVSTVKLEYADGEIYAMAGGTPAHADLGASAMRLLGNALLGRCRVSSSDLKVHVENTGLSTFPDVTIVCGPRRTAEIDPNAVINPSLLVEVTSRSTEAYDRGEKLEHYKSIPSLHAVLIVSHLESRITVHQRNDDGWAVSEHRRGDSATVDALELSLEVDELYADIELDG